jgi:hypothetical protein
MPTHPLNIGSDKDGALLIHVIYMLPKPLKPLTYWQDETSRPIHPWTSAVEPSSSTPPVCSQSH